MDFTADLDGKIMNVSEIQSLLLFTLHHYPVRGAKR